jgi:hypothetical protein
VALPPPNRGWTQRRRQAESVHEQRPIGAARVERESLLYRVGSVVLFLLLLVPLLIVQIAMLRDDSRKERD